jgi:Lsr2
MAKKTIVELTDDLDGSAADETLRLALDGTEYEIDLTKAHANQLRDALKPYVKAARKADGSRVGRRGGTGNRRPTPRDRDQVKVIRDWAKQQGMKVSARGRISRDVEKAYDDAYRSMS